MTTASLGAVTRYLRRVAGRGGHCLTDQQLLERFLHDRDEEAFADLVRRHGPMVLTVCRRVLGHEQDAEDVFQAAFLVLVRKAGSIRQQESIGGWLYRVSYRLALRARGQASRRRERPTAPAELSATAASVGPPDLLQPALDEEVQRLPERYRAVVVLCYFEGRTQAEAARLLVTTADAVNSRLKRARDLLRRRLGQRGLYFSGGVGSVLAAGAARAAVSPKLLRLTAHSAMQFAANSAAASGTSVLAVALAKGALRTMMMTKLKVLSLVAFVLMLLTAGAVVLPVLGDDSPRTTQVTPKGSSAASAQKSALSGKRKAKKRRACIILWMSGGPSQFETFDLKPGMPTGGPFKAIDTATKGVQISEHLPKLAKLTNHLAIIRSLSHPEGDHVRATYLMQTGYVHDGVTAHPALGSVLAKELGEARPELPRYVSISKSVPRFLRGPGAGFLGPQFDPIDVGLNQPGDLPELPPATAFDVQRKGRGEQMRKAVARAFDLNQEKVAVRDAYGRNPFGQGCLLARRLVEAGVPVVEVMMGGWDTHANGFEIVKEQSGRLDAGWSALLKDLKERKLLDEVVVVWMGEFGRTPRINVQKGRDHWPVSFSVVLAGRGIKGGQVIGATKADGTGVAAGAVRPAELLATVYQVLGIDLTRTNRSNNGQPVPLLTKGTRAIRQALR